jgi:hypothetical protein
MANAGDGGERSGGRDEVGMERVGLRVFTIAYVCMIQ